MGNRNFHFAIFLGPNPLTLHTDTPEVAHLDTIQTSTIWSLRLENIKIRWKKSIEPEKKNKLKYKNTSNTNKWVTHSTISKGVERLHPQWGILITIKNHQVGLHNWKTVEKYGNNQGYTVRAEELQLPIIILSITWDTRT